jgi:hypothetical protein
MIESLQYSNNKLIVFSQYLKMNHVPQKQLILKRGKANHTKRGVVAKGTH